MSSGSCDSRGRERALETAGGCCREIGSKKLWPAKKSATVAQQTYKIRQRRVAIELLYNNKGRRFACGCSHLFFEMVLPIG
jgi:hypothetical protein